MKTQHWLIAIGVALLILGVWYVKTKDKREFMAICKKLPPRVPNPLDCEVEWIKYKKAGLKS